MQQLQRQILIDTVFYLLFYSIKFQVFCPEVNIGSLIVLQFYYSMQKTIIFGRQLEFENESIPNTNTRCQLCAKLLQQNKNLNALLAEKEQEIQNMMNLSENQIVRKVQNELLDLREDYERLKNKIKQVEKQNQDLYFENTTFLNQIETLKRKLKHAKEQNAQDEERKCEVEENDLIKLEEYLEKQKKQLEVKLYVEKEKVLKLEMINQSQSEEIVKLKELIKRRNKIQQERHHLIASIS